jgi:hypothetical protein
MNRTYLIILSVLSITALNSCLKSAPFTDTDPATGLPPVALTTSTGECMLSKISQKNSGTSGADNVYQIKRDTILAANNISSYDSLRSKLEYTITIQIAGDTIKLSTGEYLIKDKTTKLISYFFTHADITDPTSDKQVYQYLYDAGGFLVKKYLYVNGATAPYYETIYSYDNNSLLTGCIVYAGSKKDKLLQSVITYDMSAAKKTWLYLFPDFFEGYKYMQAFNFGKRGNYPVKAIVTNIFDTNDGSVLDNWTTNFSGYVYSQDGFILQTTAQGDLQQGLGLLFGTNRFEYQCTK